MGNERILEQQYFLTKEDSKVSEIIEDYFKDKKIVKKDLKDFADFIGLETERIHINTVGSFLFKPTESDKEKYKNRLSKIDSELYQFRTNSKIHKEFEKRKKEGKFKLPYLALSEVLDIPSKDKYHLNLGDITGKVSQSHIKGQYLLSISFSPKIEHSDLTEIKASTYCDLLRIAKEKVEDE